MGLARPQIFSLVGIGILMIGLGVVVALSQQRQDIRKRAAGSGGEDSAVGLLQCDPGPDPYDSHTIEVTNNTDQPISSIRFDVFRCEYVPGILDEKKGRFRCDGNCKQGDPDCLKGTWDAEASQDAISLSVGETRTFVAAPRACEIVQLDVQNAAYPASECTNVQSQYTVNPGEIWPGGISFAIDDNPTGYNASSGSCPTPSPTASPTPAPPTATPQPTAPPGQPTYTPVPTVAPTQIPTSVPTVTQKSGKGGVVASTPTPIPTRPVAGGVELTIFGVLGGIGLIILGLL